MTTLRIVSTSLMLMLAAIPALAGDWQNWRGPHHTGVADDAPMPAVVDPEKDVRWSVDLPGPSSGSPIVSGDRVFVTSNDATLKKGLAFCIDRVSGNVIWQKELTTFGDIPARNNFASSSPVTDGKMVWFTYGSTDVFALDYDGNVVWSKNLTREFGNSSQQFGYSSTPLFYRDKLYVQILCGQWHSDVGMSDYTDADSRIVCLDAATGNTVWNFPRKSDAVGESFDSYATPVPFVSNGVEAIVVQGGDYLSANDAATGKELWRQEHNPGKESNWRLIPSPVVMGDLVFGVQPRGGDGFAVKPGDKTYFAFDESFWRLEEKTTDVPTPVFYKDRLYILIGTRGLLLSVDPKTGEKLWRHDLDANARIWASPTVADDKMYCLDEDGQLTIASIADEFKVLCQADFGGKECKSTVAIAHGDLFIRTSERLVCVGS